ncbi:MAG: DUF2970 domain-containing protein [Pseudomonadota bacterium]
MSVRRVCQAVFWSFFGVRKGRDLESDAAHIKPVHIVLAGMLGAVIFVVSLIVLVSWITH